MSINATPQGERPHIAFFGRTNAGKSSLVNAITSQKLAIVSDLPGTTTDPVQKAMEILPAGPVLVIDTPGLDDESALGKERIAQTMRIVRRTDLAILVCEEKGLTHPCEYELLEKLKKQDTPVLIVANKVDLLAPLAQENLQKTWEQEKKILPVSAKKAINLTLLKEELAQAIVEAQKEESRILVRDLVKASNTCLLVIPIDSAAPKGRLILPQQQVIRDLLEGHAIPVVTSVETLPKALDQAKPSLVICDSQVFEQVASLTPESIPLTSFSILMARYKGFLFEAMAGISAIAHLKDGDTILMAEGCTHHRQCEDIGTVKIPRWLLAHTKKDLHFATSSGRDYPSDLSNFSLVILCGGCMLNAREMQARVQQAKDQGVAVTNYGIVIAHMRGILTRATQMLV